MNKQRELKLAQAAVAMRASNPNGWNVFLALLAERLDEVTELMVSATPDAVHQAQGRAIEARAMFKELADAPSLVEKMQEIERGKAARKP
jgi:hypothetical protein